MTTLKSTTLEIVNLIKDTFNGYESVQADKVSFGEAVSLLNSHIQVMRIKIKNADVENIPSLRIILGKMNAYKMQLEDIV